MNISNIIGLLNGLESSDIAVDQHRCVLVRNRNVSCRRCAEACVTGCISLSEGQLKLEPQKCTGCGTCSTVCPSGAIMAQKPNDSELLAACLAVQLATEGTTTIACEYALDAHRGGYDLEKVVGVTCLGRIDESLLMHLIEKGADSVVLVQGDCERCAYACGIKTAQRVVQTTNVLLETWCAKTRIQISRSLPLTTQKSHDPYFDSGKREFFITIKDRIKSTAASFAVDSSEDVDSSNESLPYFIPARRKMLLETLEKIGFPQSKQIATHLWGRAIVDSATCTSCGMCETFCPTGALTKNNSKEDTPYLLHVPSTCVQCRSCEDICRSQSIRISDEVRAVDLLKGFAQRYDIELPVINHGGPHSAVNTIRRLIGSSHIYER